MTEWKDGILSTIFKSCSEDEKPYEKWILFDGPIDAMWIESMNSVMDDNKILTLINGDRIPLTNTMSLVFETQDLRVASPATVSRAGKLCYLYDRVSLYSCTSLLACNLLTHLMNP